MLNTGTSISPSSRDAVENRGVNDPAHSAPNTVLVDRSMVRSASFAAGKVISKRSADNADQKLKVPVVVGDSNNLMRAAKLISEQMRTICATARTTEMICTKT